VLSQRNYVILDSLNNIKVVLVLDGGLGEHRRVCNTHAHTRYFPCICAPPDPALPLSPPPHPGRVTAMKFGVWLG